MTQASADSEQCKADYNIHCSSELTISARAMKNSSNIVIQKKKNKIGFNCGGVECDSEKSRNSRFGFNFIKW